MEKLHRILKHSLLFSLLLFCGVSFSQTSFTVTDRILGNSSGSLDYVLTQAVNSANAGNNVTVYFNVPADANGRTLCLINQTLPQVVITAGSITFDKAAGVTTPQGMEWDGMINPNPYFFFGKSTPVNSANKIKIKNIKIKGLYNSGVISASGTSCSGTSSLLSISGQHPGASIQWQSSTNNTTFTNISGATGITYTTPTLTATTYFRAILTVGVDQQVTNTLTISIQNNYAGTITALSYFLCTGNSTTLTLSGQNPSATIQWQSSVDNTSFTNIGGATGTIYTTPALTATQYYKVIVSMPGCDLPTNTQTIIASPACADATTATTGYTELKRDQSSGYALAVEGKVKFSFDEEYVIPSGKYLPYKIYDDNRNLMASCTLNGITTNGAVALPYTFDDNRYTLTLSGITNIVIGKYYILEMETTTGEKRYLRILYKY